MGSVKVPQTQVVFDQVSDLVAIPIEVSELTAIAHEISEIRKLPAVTKSQPIAARTVREKTP
jgi:hypothetical protein